jgi:hypothetical protein
MGERRNVYRLLVGKPERKRPLGRPRRRWVAKFMYFGTSSSNQISFKTTTRTDYFHGMPGT